MLRFAWQAQHFGRVHHHFAWQAQHFRRVVLRVFANRIVRAALSGDKVQIPWQAWHFVRCDEHCFCGRRNAVASFSEGELQFSWHVQHFGDLHRHFTWQAQHLRRVALRAQSSTLYTHTPHFAFHTLHSTVHSTLYTLQSVLYTPHSTLHTSHSTLYTVITLHTQHFTLYTPYFASSTAQSGGGNFHNRKPIGEIACCKSRMAERSH